MRGIIRLHQLIIAATFICLAAGTTAHAQEPSRKYLLTPSELQALQSSVGKPTDKVVSLVAPVYRGLGRVFWYMAEPYDETISYDPGGSQTRLGHILHNDAAQADDPDEGSPLAIDQDRFVFGGLPRCVGNKRCDGWAAVVADLKTGHVVSAILDTEIDKGSREQKPLMIFSVACADAELKSAARPLFDRLAADMLKQSIQWTPTAPAGRKPAPLKAKPIVTSCDGKLVSPLPNPKAQVAAAPALSAKAWAYRLTEKDTAALRDAVGKNTHDLLRDKKTGKRLEQAFRGVSAGVEVKPGYSYYKMFELQIGGIPEPVELLGDRFLFVHGCMFRSCPDKGAFIADLVTGHLMMAVIAYDGPWTVHKDCINGELEAFAGKRLAAWAEAARLDAWDPDRPRKAVVTKTRC